MFNARSPRVRGMSRTGRFGLVTISLQADRDTTPSNSQAEVVAQDRWLVMDPQLHIDDDTTADVDLAGAQAMDIDRTPGEILLRRGSRPLRLWAVIHDLNRIPTCRQEWVAVALRNLLRELGCRKIESVSMPCLGYEQGVVDARQFLRLLANAIDEASVVHRLRINLRCESGARDSLHAALQQLQF